MDSLRDKTSDVIYVDIDQEFTAWSPKIWSIFSRRCQECAEKFGVGFTSVWVRRSSSGRAHAKIVFSRSVTIDETFLMRAFLGDDPYRLVTDMNRWVKYGAGAEINRIYDSKFIGGEVRQAGPWLPIAEMMG